MTVNENPQRYRLPTGTGQAVNLIPDDDGDIILFDDVFNNGVPTPKKATEKGGKSSKKK